MKKISRIIVLMMFVLVVLGAGLGLANPGGAITGKVLETMDSGGYTYVSLDTGSSTVWVAVPKSKVKKGDTIKVSPGVPMSNFTSKTLNKTFDVIYFSPGIIK